MFNMDHLRLNSDGIATPCYFIRNITLCGQNMVGRKLKIVFSVKVSRLVFVPLPIADQLEPNFYNLPCVEQRITELD